MPDLATQFESDHQYFIIYLPDAILLLHLADLIFTYQGTWFDQYYNKVIFSHYKVLVLTLQYTSKLMNYYFCYFKRGALYSIHRIAPITATQPRWPVHDADCGQIR